MRIIKAGKVRYLRGTCDHCQCEVETDLHDPEVKTREADADSTPHFIDCPTPHCGHYLYLWEREGFVSDVGRTEE